MTLMRSFAVWLVASTLAWPTAAEVVHREWADTIVKGTWLPGTDGSAVTRSDSLQVHLTHQPAHSLRLSHTYGVAPQLLPPHVVPYVTTAHAGLTDIATTLTQLRGLALEASTLGVADTDRLDTLQRRLEAGLAVIQDIARYTEYNERPLLDGSLGIRGMTDDPRVEVVRPPSVLPREVVSVAVQLPAERAFVRAAETQTGPLAADEILTINDVSLVLPARSSQATVIDTINGYTEQTGVKAGISPADGSTVLYSSDAGHHAHVSVVSNQPAKSDTSGVGTSWRYDRGQDIQVQIGDASFIGTGNLASVPTGSLAGLTLRFPFSETLLLASATGDHGPVTFRDAALPYTTPRGGSARLWFLDAHPQRLGTGVPGHGTTDLAAVRIDNATDAQDGIGVLDQAWDEVHREISRLAALEFGLPDGQATISSPDSVRLLVDAEGSIRWLTAGTSLGPGEAFAAGTFPLLPDRRGYLGVELASAQGNRYGWLQLATDGDSGIVVEQFAWRQTAGQAIVVGAVPEPAGGWLVGLTAWALYDVLRRGHARR